MAVDHYENFPVASLLLPRALRPAVEAIYHFARTADDIADEGDLDDDERLRQLAEYRAALRAIRQGQEPLPAGHPRAGLFLKLQAVIRQHALPVQAFDDLISAFEQDVSTTRYADDAALMDYCRRSANPVGCLMLHLYGEATPLNLEASDAICTGLQLANFWQDVAIDWRKGRIYVPQQRLQMHGVDDATWGHWCETGQPGPQWQRIMQAQVAQARGLLLQGAPLAIRLPGRIGLELRLVVLGGLRILERLDALHYDVFRQRPTLGKRDWATLVWRALFYRANTARAAFPHSRH